MFKQTKNLLVVGASHSSQRSLRRFLDGMAIDITDISLGVLSEKELAIKNLVVLLDFRRKREGIEEAILKVKSFDSGIPVLLVAEPTRVGEIVDWRLSGVEELLDPATFNWKIKEAVDRAFSRNDIWYRAILGLPQIQKRISKKILSGVIECEPGLLPRE